MHIVLCLHFQNRFSPFASIVSASLYPRFFYFLKEKKSKDKSKLIFVVINIMPHTLSLELNLLALNLEYFLTYRQ